MEKKKWWLKCNKQNPQSVKVSLHPETGIATVFISRATTKYDDEKRAFTTRLTNVTLRALAKVSEFELAPHP